MKSNPSIEISGTCQNKFKPVQTAFLENFKNLDEVGAALTIFHKGKKVVDIWGGLKNQNTSEPWLEDTMVSFFSVTKGITALCFLILADRKKVDYEKLVSSYWPEFGKHGKEKITVRQLLEHTAGLHALDTKLKLSDFWLHYDKVYEAMIQQVPAWEPGTKQGYGAQIWGAYAAELFRRIADESCGTFFQREVASKLNLNLFLGIPYHHSNRVATIYPISNIARIMKIIPQIISGEGCEGRAGRAVLRGKSEVSRAYMNPSVGMKGLETFNDPNVQSKELLWANGIGDARSLASIFNVLAMGGKLGKIQFVSPNTLKKVTAKKELKYDEVIHKNLGWNFGFLKEEDGLFSPNSETFGHAGMGGSLAFADTKAQISFGYVTSKMDYRVRAPKTLALCQAVYKCI